MKTQERAKKNVGYLENFPMYIVLLNENCHGLHRRARKIQSRPIWKEGLRKGKSYMLRKGATKSHINKNDLT